VWSWVIECCCCLVKLFILCVIQRRCSFLVDSRKMFLHLLCDLREVSSSFEGLKGGVHHLWISGEVSFYLKLFLFLYVINLFLEFELTPLKRNWQLDIGSFDPNQFKIPCAIFSFYTLFNYLLIILTESIFSWIRF